LNESVGISVVVISKSDDHVQAINTALRDGGHPSHCIKVKKLTELEVAINEQNPQLIIVFGSANPASLAPAVDTRDACGPEIPLLLVTEDVTENVIGVAWALGARVVVSIRTVERLQAVATRELRSCRLENALESVMSSAKQYKDELNSLKQISVEAIADIQEGIIVNANPAWLELFGWPEEGELTGHPVMDLCAEADRPTLKGALVACQRGKWQDSKLNAKGLRSDGTDFSVAFSLKNADYDGEPAVRMIVAPDIPESNTPVTLVEQAVQRDPFTGFYNRQHFLNSCRKRVDIAPTGGVRAVAYIRPDRFSRARDDIGLMGTESVISQLAQILVELVQPTDIYGRFGGTMFAMVIERGTMTDVEAWAEQLLQTIGETVFEHEERSTSITCSVGICELDSPDKNFSELICEAEHACRNARAKGGNAVELSESSGAAKKIRQDDTIWVPKIRGALMENRLRLEHQPVASLNEDISGAYDTLVRMVDEEGNTVLPSEFMQVAERTGLTKNIDRWVVGASLSFCAANQVSLLFIRISRDSLLDETLIDWLKTQVKERKIPPAKICLEVSEDVAVQHLRQTQALAVSLRKAGFKFAIEHFGKSENSKRVLQKIPMEFVKIDGSLMQGLHKNATVQTSIKELARLASEKNIRTVAERVQDANTMAILWQLGISYIQGNYVQNSEIVIEDTSQTSTTTKVLEMATEN
jgi:diguanylate cyclase (GGDEF)-like protein/PAS domain S-box-containing protein